MEDATLSGKQVKINKNRFLFPACALHYHIFMCTCVCIQFPQQTRRKVFCATTAAVATLEMEAGYYVRSIWK
jgi:hypothetical protein